MSSAEQSFAYLGAMTDDFGTFEHADGATPRREHGYCTDDMARLLVVATRQPHPSDVVRDLARRALRFVADAQGVRGDCLNRRDSSGRWLGMNGKVKSKKHNEANCPPTQPLHRIAWRVRGASCHA